MSIIVGNAKSKTSWLATALIVVGSVQEFVPSLIDLVPKQHQGKLIAALGLVLLILRNLTKESISDKGAKDETS